MLRRIQGRYEGEKGRAEGQGQEQDPQVGWHRTGLDVSEQPPRGDDHDGAADEHGRGQFGGGVELGVAAAVDGGKGAHGDATERQAGAEGNVAAFGEAAVAAGDHDAGAR